MNIKLQIIIILWYNLRLIGYYMAFLNRIFGKNGSVKKQKNRTQSDNPKLTQILDLNDYIDNYFLKILISQNQITRKKLT